MHVPMCLTCQRREVAGAYANEDGTGFCSAVCADVDGPTMMRETLKNIWEVVFKDEKKVWMAFGAMHAMVDILSQTAREEDVKYHAKHLHSIFKGN